MGLAKNYKFHVAIYAQRADHRETEYKIKKIVSCMGYGKGYATWTSLTTRGKKSPYMFY